MAPLQRVAMAFVAVDGEILLARLPPKASAYAGRYTTASGPITDGETPELAARRALSAELGVVAAGLVGGLPVDFTDTVRRKAVHFRLYPYLCEVGSRSLVAASGTDLRWLPPEDVVVAAAHLTTVPELDEALARVWDPPGALPPPFREAARAIWEDRAAATFDLAARAAALVGQGAPPERVAALRPARARFVHAARNAVDPSRDVIGELTRSLDAALRSAVAPFFVAECVTARGDVIAPIGGEGMIIKDGFAQWGDDFPPPLSGETSLEVRRCL